MMFLAAASPHVSVGADQLFSLGPLGVTNSMIYGLIGSALCWWLLLYSKKRIAERRYSRIALAVLWAYEYLLDTMIEVLGDRKLALRLSPLAITMFFFIVINNWIEILPVLGPITWNGLPLFRGLAADLNFTFALAVVTFVTAQVWAIQHLGFFGNLGRYFRNPFKDVLGAFEGFLELIAEFSRFIALSMRLFGNIFGGEVLLVVMAFITQYATPITLPPFMLFELFIGLVQAYIFFMLTTVFVSLGLNSHDAPASEPDAFEPKDEAAAWPQPVEAH
jgi:F-type H+-transporting ATPase subunit a